MNYSLLILEEHGDVIVESRELIIGIPRRIHNPRLIRIRMQSDPSSQSKSLSTTAAGGYFAGVHDEYDVADQGNDSGHNTTDKTDTTITRVRMVEGSTMAISDCRHEGAQDD